MWEFEAFFSYTVTLVSHFFTVLVESCSNLKYTLHGSLGLSSIFGSDKEYAMVSFSDELMSVNSMVFLPILKFMFSFSYPYTMIICESRL